MYYDKQGILLDVMDWAKRFEDIKYRRIALYKGPFVDVSTVWLGLNHNYGKGAPLIFETMVFTKWSSIGVDTNRYATEAEAIEGHKQMVKRYRWRLDLLFRR